MNRFDNGSVSAYTPQSFQELSFVPMMKRAQHDEMSKNIAALDAIATDPLNEHRDEALRLKQEFEGKLGNMSGELASKGIDNIGRENFYRLKKEHDDLIAPTGKIGQINAAKVAEAKAKEDFMKNADKSFGQNVLEQKWLEHRQNYADMKGRDKDGNIINISNLGSPKYVDLDTGIRDVLSTLGHTTREKLLNSGLSFKNTEYGPVMVNSQGSVVTKTNDEQLNNALNALKTRFIDKTGEGRISRDFEGRTTDEDLNYINSRVLGAKIFEQNEDYKTNYDRISTGDGSGDGSETPGGGKIISGESKIEASSKYDNYSDALNEIKTLNSTIASGKGTTADKIRRNELIELRRIADSKMNQIPRYKEINNKLNSELNQWKNLSTKFNLSDNDKKVIKDNPNLIPQLLFSKGIGNYKGDKNDPALKMILDDSKLSNFNNLIKERQNYKDTAWNNSSKVINTYNYIPTTTAEANDFENFNFQAGNIIKNAKNIDNVLDIVDISQDDNNYSKITPNHTKALTAAMKNMDPKSFTISNPTPSGPGGRPQVTITFTTKKGAKSSDIDDSGTFYDDTLGGEEKTISFVANLKNSKDNPHSADMIGGLSKHLRDYYGGKGEVIKQGVGAGLRTGDHLKNTMIYNQYRGNTIEELSNAAYSTDGITVQMKDEDAFNLLAGKAAQKGMRVDDYIKYYGKEKI